jgi:hypothetical protein
MITRFCALLLLIGSLLDQSTAQPSRIELKSHYSAILSQNKQFNILFPDGYDGESDRYPVVYLFRGAVDEWADPSEDGSRRGTIKTVYDSLFAKNKVGKMILVMPGLGAPAPQIEYQYLIDELIPYVDANFRTIPTRWQRSMDGFSLGGLIVTNLLAAAPNYFISAGSYDGTLSLFDNALFSSASPQLIYSLKQMQLLYHTASTGGNNHNNNMTTFSILNAKGISNALPSYGLDPNAQHNWYYADWHMAVTLPLHWNKMQSSPNSLDLTLKMQLLGQSVSGNVMLNWARRIVPTPVKTYLLYSKDNGKHWTSFFSSQNNDSVYVWNTVPLSDGTRYRIKVLSAGDTLSGTAVSEVFTVNNPGNGTPDVEYTGLKANDTISGNYSLQWLAGDADGDAVSIDIALSYNNGLTWNSLVTSFPNVSSYLFNSRDVANSSSVLFRITARDGISSSTAVSPSLVLYNKRIKLLNAFFHHQSGYSDAAFAAVGMSIDSLRSANYTITVKENGTKKSYSVFNANGIEVVKEATELDGRTEGPLFDGFRLLVQDYPMPVVNVDSLRWTTGSSPLTAEVKLIDVVTESGTITAVPFPSDYEVRISNAIADTSLSLYGTTGLPVPFSIWNETLKKKTHFVLVEIDGNGILSRNDELYLIEDDTAGSPMLTWHVQFVGNENAAHPLPGDIFRIKILKPLRADDRYHFLFTPPLSVNTVNESPNSYMLSQNFPNPFNPSTTISFSIAPSAAAGQKPAFERARLDIYDILGRHITRLIDGLYPPGSYSIQWNAGSYANGIYLYRLTSGTFTDTKKMLLTK